MNRMLEEIKKYSIRKYNQQLDEEIKKGVSINLDNVRDLWELYENTIDAYTDENCVFEKFVKYDVTRCERCGNYVLKEDISNNDYVVHDHICKYCTGEDA